MSLITFEFLPAGTSSDLILTHLAAYFEGSGGPQMREAGWNTLMNQLAERVESR